MTSQNSPSRAASPQPARRQLAVRSGLHAGCLKTVNTPPAGGGPTFTPIGPIREAIGLGTGY